MKTRLLFIALILVISTALAFALPRGKTALALFKSSENQTWTENEINYFAVKDLVELGLEVKFWDIDSGIPPEWQMQGVRAIISWFRGPSMYNALAYIEFLNRSIDAGIKLIVLDNFGAYQERTTGAYLSPGEMNTTLSRLGLWYLGDWTEDASLIQIASKDSDMVEANGRQNKDLSKFFYRFLPVDRNLRVYLSLNRTDKRYDPSPVVVTNSNGGFALSRYIFHYIDGKVQMLLNMGRFLKEALFPPPVSDLVLLIADPGSKSTKKILYYTEGILRQAKIPYEVIDKSLIPALLASDLIQYTAVGLILLNDAGLTPSMLNAYVAQGGGLVCLYPGAFNEIKPALSIGPREVTENFITGFRFNYGFTLGEGIVLEVADYDWTPGRATPSGDATILATDSLGGTALLWSFKRGAGRGIVWNWAALDTGDFEGFILESFLSVRPVGAAVAAGIGIMYLDDWPLPMYNNVKPPLNTSTTEFYTKQWWPDIKAFFKQYSIPYTAYIIFNYNNDTEYPFTEGEFYVADDNASVKAAREILESGGDLGFHGFNHISPTLTRSKQNKVVWPSLQAIEDAWKASKRTWTRLFGESTLPFSYVAPHNIISDDAIPILRRVFPTIKVVSALRTTTEDETVQAFGPHPTISDLYYIPRQTSGYHFTPFIQQVIASSISGTGIWAHFVHADDLFDPARSRGKSWDLLKADFHKMINFVKQNYPWIKFVTVRDAYYILQNIENAGVEFSWNNAKNTLTVQSSVPGLYVRLRTNTQLLTELDGAEIVYKYTRMPVIILKLTKPVHRLVFHRLGG